MVREALAPVALRSVTVNGVTLSARAPSRGSRRRSFAATGTREGREHEQGREPHEETMHPFSRPRTTSIACPPFGSVDHHGEQSVRNLAM